MLRKEFFTVLFSGLLILGLSGTALADIGTEAGGEIVSTEQALMAAENYSYDQERLALVGTEAGVTAFDSDAPSTKADLAAAKHVYDERVLDAIGTEAGVDPSGSATMCAAC